MVWVRPPLKERSPDRFAFHGLRRVGEGAVVHYRRGRSSVLQWSRYLSDVSWRARAAPEKTRREQCNDFRGDSKTLHNNCKNRMMLHLGAHPVLAQGAGSNLQMMGKYGRHLDRMCNNLSRIQPNDRCIGRPI